MTKLRNYIPYAIALFAAAALSALAAVFAATFIEARSFADVRSALKLAGLEWASVTTDGLQVTLIGTAPTEPLRFRALSVAGTIVDPARVIDAMEVEERAIIAPHFSIEILRNDDGISLIGLVPAELDRDALMSEISDLAQGQQVTDLLQSAAYPLPEKWDRALAFALYALTQLPRAKISMSAERVLVNALGDSEEAKNRLEIDLKRKTPEGVIALLNIAAPRPAITPFTLRFVIDSSARARFDACSADTEGARNTILQAGIDAGATGQVTCTIGLGAPSPRWGQAASLAIKAVKELGGGSVTFSDSDISLIALETVERDHFETVIGTLDKALPDAFSLHATRPEPIVAEGATATTGPAELVASRTAEGGVILRGQTGSLREQQVIDGFARAMFGAANVNNITRVVDGLPAGWPVRTLAALDALTKLESGKVIVQPELVKVQGETGDPSSKAEITRVLSDKLGEGANFDIQVNYVETLDPTLGLPSPEECVANLNAILSAEKLAFAPGSPTIEGASSGALNKMADAFEHCTEVPMEIGAHSDSQGREEMNQALSQSRAEAVLTALIERRVLTTNLTAHGYGEAVPIADNKTEEGRETNRRIEFKLLLADEGAEAIQNQVDTP
jgi:OmpA-OmpF porin, OOP family